MAPSTSAPRPMCVEASITDRVDPCPLSERDVRAEDGVRADGRLARDSAVVPEEGRALEPVDVVEVDALPHPDVAPQTDAGDVQADALVERVEIGLPVLIEVADVLPVALHRLAVERATHLEQERKELLGEVVRLVGRDVAQHLRLQDVDAGVDRVREDLAPRRLLQEALDPSVLVGDDDPELEGVLDRLEADRHRRPFLLVELDELRQVEVAERVARDDEEGVVEPVRGQANRAGSAERRLLDGVLHVQPEGLAVSEVRADRLRQERDGDDHVLEAMLAEELHDVLHAGLADDRDHRLRLVRGQRAEPRALAAGHDDGLHVSLPRTAVMRYWAAAATASATPNQKTQSGQSALGSVRRTKKSAK